jgi:hypothetical protein
MLYQLPFSMLRGLVVTLTVETGLAALIGFRKRDLLFVVLVNMLTNPPVVLLTYLSGLFWGWQTRIAALIVLEAAAYLTEALIYRSNLRKQKPHPFLLSLILNAASYGSGLLLNIILN